MNGLEAGRVPSPDDAGKLRFSLTGDSAGARTVQESDDGGL